VTAGNGGSSQVLVLNGINGNGNGFTAFSTRGAEHQRSCPCVAALDENGDRICDFILTAQGTDGATRKIHEFDALTGDLVDQVMESSPDFCGAYFLATLKGRPTRTTL
jgi:hypothetical protein